MPFKVREHSDLELILVLKSLHHYRNVTGGEAEVIPPVLVFLSYSLTVFVCICNTKSGSKLQDLARLGESTYIDFPPRFLQVKE